MERSKYKFYLGILRTPTFTEGYFYDTDTGEILARDGAYATRSRISIPDGCTAIYLDMYSSYYYGSYVLFYDSNGAYLTGKYTLIYTYVDTRWPRVIEIPEGAAYITIAIHESDAKGITAVSNNKDVLYFLREANPYYKELKKKWKKEDDQMFMRQELDGDINFHGYDYEFVYDADIESKFIFIITKYTTGVALNVSSNLYLINFKGTFAKTDCEFDFMKKICTPDVEVLDDYNTVLDKYDNDYDLIKLAPAVSTMQMYSRPVWQVYISGSSVISNFYGNLYWEADVSDSVDDYVELTSTYHFAYYGPANEIYITGSSVEEINGYYAGINTDSGTSLTLYNNKGYAIQILSPTDWDSMSSLILIKRVSDNQFIYFGSVTTSYRPTGAEDIAANLGGLHAQTQENKTLLAYSDNGVVANGETCTVDYVFAYYLYERMLCNVDEVTDSEGTKSTYDLDSDDFAASDSNFSKCIGFVGNTIVCSAATAAEGETTQWGVNDEGLYFTSNVVSLTTGLGRPLPVCRNSWVNASFWFFYSTAAVNWETNLKTEYTLKDAYSIGACIKAFLNEIDPTLKHEETEEYSQFLYGDSFPLSNMPTKFYVYLTPKSNILAGNYDQAAQTAELTFEDLMDMLRKCFRCYWFIEDGKFRVEHIRYFMNGRSYDSSPSSQLDFTALTDQFNKKPTAYYQSEIEYDKSELAARYEFDWGDDCSEAFGEFAIDIDSYYIQQDDTEDVTESNFASDVDLMLLNPDNFDEDGFALLCPLKNSAGTLYLPIVEADMYNDNGVVYQALCQNFYASWLYLVRCYMYDLPARSVSSDIVPNLTAYSVKKCMRHTIEFQSENDLDELQTITTALGEGTIEEMEVSLDTRMFEVDLVYTPK